MFKAVLLFSFIELPAVTGAPHHTYALVQSRFGALCATTKDVRRGSDSVMEGLRADVE